MELESLFTEQKWEILKKISQEPLSPLQLAERSSTSMANISQQLKILEISSIVKKKKVPNRDRGKPRSIFSLNSDYAYIISAMNGFAEKKLISLEGLQKILFRSWFLDESIKYYVEKFLWKNEEHIPDISHILVKDEGNRVLVVIGTGKKEVISKKVKGETVKGVGHLPKEVIVKVVPPEQISKMTDKDESFVVIHSTEDKL